MIGVLFLAEWSKYQDFKIEDLNEIRKQKFSNVQVFEVMLHFTYVKNTNKKVAVFHNATNVLKGLPGTRHTKQPSFHSLQQ